MNWQSSSWKFPTISRATSQASAIFEASRSSETIDSPKKAAPNDTP